MQIRKTIDLGGYSSIDRSIFNALSHENNFIIFEHFGWNVGIGLDLSTIIPLGCDIMYQINGGNQCRKMILSYNDPINAFIHLSLDGEMLDVTLSSNKKRPDIIEQLKKLAPLSPKKQNCVSINFWTSGDDEEHYTRTISVLPWNEIKINYSLPVVQNLSKYINPQWRPTEGGKLILWRGKPGTGKTWAIRALMSEWDDWAQFNYITDPEKFLNSAEYMMSVIGHDQPYGDKNLIKWKLLLLEDSGELMSTDSKERIGQGISRLLNLTDGLIGQGMKILLLVTTNEEVNKLNEAVSRSGRCISNVEFLPLSPSESTTWAEQNGIDTKMLTREITIADLYAIKNGEQPKFLQFNKLGF